VSILVHDHSLAGNGELVGKVVDMIGLVPLAVCINHRSAVPVAREAFFLQVPLFLAVPTDDVRVSGVAVTGLPIVGRWAIGIHLGREAVVTGLDSGNLFDLLLNEILPDDVAGFIWLKFCFNGGNPLQFLVIVLDGLQVLGHLHTLSKGVLLASRTLSQMVSLSPARKSSCLTNLKASEMPLALA